MVFLPFCAAYVVSHGLACFVSGVQFFHHVLCLLVQGVAGVPWIFLVQQNVDRAVPPVVDPLCQVMAVQVRMDEGGHYFPAVFIEMVKNFRSYQDADVCICGFGDVGNKVASDPDFDAVRTQKVYEVVNRLDHGSEKLCPEAVGNDAFHKGDPHMAKGVVVGPRRGQVSIFIKR